MTKRKINTAWTRGLEGESKTRFQEQLLSNHAVFDRLIAILEDLKDKTTVKAKDYKEADWAYKQAHLNGMNEGYDNVLELIRTLTDND